MRLTLLLVAVMLVGARLFTGIVYEQDDPTTYLVLRSHPSLVIVQTNAADSSVPTQFTILDESENLLGYDDAYVGAMQGALPAAALCIAAALALVRVGRTRRSAAL